MSTYQAVYQQTPAVERSRLTVFFRIFMVIPHMILSFFYGIAAQLALIVAWFAIVFTGRYPAGIYEFVAGYLRFSTRLLGYMLLVTDEFPPFDGGEHPEYPVNVRIGPPQESYSRLTTFFRFILLIPVAIIQYVFILWAEVVAIDLVRRGVHRQDLGRARRRDALPAGLPGPRLRLRVPADRRLAAV